MLNEDDEARCSAAQSRLSNQGLLTRRMLSTKSAFSGTALSSNTTDSAEPATGGGPRLCSRSLRRSLRPNRGDKRRGKWRQSVPDSCSSC